MSMLSPEGGDYLDAQQVAALFGYRLSALYAQRHRGEAPGALAVKVGRKLIWRRSDLDEWFESQVAAQRATVGL